MPDMTFCLSAVLGLIVHCAAQWRRKISNVECAFGKPRPTWMEWSDLVDGGNVKEPQFVDPSTGVTYPLDSGLWRSPTGVALMMTPLEGLRRDQIVTADRSMWRYRAALPIDLEPPVSLGEGCTPLLASSFRGNRCRFKLEWFSPTGSFKDRGASALISFLKQHGIDEILEDSSGNGGAAIAAYGAAAGMTVTILVPEKTLSAKVVQSRASGAVVRLVPGDREATEQAALEMSSEIFYAGHNWHPMFLQGTKTLGYEIWEDLGFRVPDSIVIPASAGSSLLGCYLAFTELLSSGEAERLPKLFMAQPANCAPVHASFQAGIDHLVEGDWAPTIADGTAIKRPVRLQQMLTALRDSDGGTVAVPEDAIRSASLELAGRGLYVEPTSALVAAGYSQLIEQGTLAEHEETVVVLTGSGLKATGFYEDLVENAPH